MLCCKGCLWCDCRRVSIHPPTPGYRGYRRRFKTRKLS